MEHRVKRIALIGMGRSGTSFVAEFLARSGVNFDEDGLPSKGKQRKFEHPLAREINDAVLAEHVGAREHPPYGKLPKTEIYLEEPWRSRVADFVGYMDRMAASDGVSQYWAVKDPRTTILHSLWLEKFDIIVAIFRNPLHVVDSYLAKGWIHGLRKRRTALRYWTRFNQSLIAIHNQYAGVKPMYVIDFNADVPKQLANLCARLAIPEAEGAFALYKPGRESNRLGLMSRLRLAGDASRTYEELMLLRNLL
jgi:hypothetical protein